MDKFIERDETKKVNKNKKNYLKDYSNHKKNYNNITVIIINT